MCSEANNKATWVWSLAAILRSCRDRVIILMDLDMKRTPMLLHNTLVILSTYFPGHFMASDSSHLGLYAKWSYLVDSTSVIYV